MGVTLRISGDPSGICSPAHPGDAGFDLVAAEEVYLGPDERALVSTGVRVEIPVGYAGFVLPRSSANRTAVVIPNAPGLIDSGYRGEIKVGQMNLGDEDYVIREGDRIAQLVIVAVPAVNVYYVPQLSPSARGEAGFGSTGK